MKNIKLGNKIAKKLLINTQLYFPIIRFLLLQKYLTFPNELIIPSFCSSSKCADTFIIITNYLLSLNKNNNYY